MKNISVENTQGFIPSINPAMLTVIGCFLFFILKIILPIMILLKISLKNYSANNDSAKNLS